MKTVYTEAYKEILRWLKGKRNQAGLTQQELSSKLGKPQSYVSKYEKGERRLDIVEFISISVAINADPDEIIHQIIGKIREQ